jgi:hypothetical protein
LTKKKRERDGVIDWLLVGWSLVLFVVDGKEEIFFSSSSVNIRFLLVVRARERERERERETDRQTDRQKSSK